MLTKEQRRAAVKAAADRVMPGIAAVLKADAAIAKAKASSLKSGGGFSRWVMRNRDGKEWVTDSSYTLAELKRWFTAVPVRRFYPRAPK